jgi:release factor glutamine methyltransferase
MKYTDITSDLRSRLADFYPDRELESIARLIAEHVTGLSWVQIRMNPDTEFTDSQRTDIGIIIKRLGDHEPIQYVLGETEFYGLKLKVRPGVLIPRGETEEIVEWVIKAKGERRKAKEKSKEERRKIKERLQDKKEDKRENGKGIILDIGCGSGAISIALAKYLPDYEIVASDISDVALEITDENAHLNYVEITSTHLDILKSSSFAFRLSPFALIVSNPPYIPQSEKVALAHHVANQEPDLALFVPDEDPLVFYRAIAEFARINLEPGGQVFVEIHDRLGAETVALFSHYFSDVELRQDIHGKDRMIRASNG